MENGLNDFKLYIMAKNKQTNEGDEFVYHVKTFTKDREIDAEHLRWRKTEEQWIIYYLSGEMNIKGGKNGYL